jgi:hypothetical protein
MLDASELDRATFGYVAPMPAHGIRGSSPFDGVDREVIVETYETPPLVDAALPGTYSNATARSIATSIWEEPRDSQTGTISEQVSSDGTVRGRSADFVLQKSFEQNADGSGHSTATAPGFSTVDLQIAPATLLPAEGTFEIPVATRSTGREIGPPPYPVTTNSYRLPDWYPGGKGLPADTDVLTASGAADTPVPAACGAVSHGRLAHEITDRRAWTRITGITEADSDETYWAGRILVCEIERRHTEKYDLASGKRSATDDTTTTLGITKL